MTDLSAGIQIGCCRGLIRAFDPLTDDRGWCVYARGKRERQLFRMLLQHDLILVLAGNAHRRFDKGLVFLLQFFRHGSTRLGDDLILPILLQNTVSGAHFIVDDLVGKCHALQKKLADLCIDGIDIFADLIQIAHNHIPPDKDQSERQRQPPR